MKHTLVWVLALAAQWSLAGDLTMRHAYALATAPGQPNGVGYVHLDNSGAQPLVLNAARSPVAERVEFHRHVHSNGQMRMEPVATITVPAGGSVAFEPGAYHLMLLQLQKPLTPGEEVTVTLGDAEGREWSFALPVRDPRSEHQPQHHH